MAGTAWNDLMSGAGMSELRLGTTPQESASAVAIADSTVLNPNLQPFIRVTSTSAIVGTQLTKGTRVGQTCVIAIESGSSIAFSATSASTANVLSASGMAGNRAYQFWYDATLAQWLIVSNA